MIFSCSGVGDWANRINWNDFQLENLPGQEDYPDEAAILLLDEGKMEVFGSNSQDGFSVFEQHRIYKILNHRGQRYANIVIAYTPNTYVEKISARTISSSGEITVLNKKDIYDVNLYPTYIFYSDQRAKIFSMPAIANGSILEYKYSIRINSRTFRHSWNFQTEIPTLISRFTLVKPAAWEVYHKVYGIDLEPRIDENPDGFKSTLVWETLHMPAIKPEFGMPPTNEVVASLAISPVGIKSWDDVAKWYHELAGPQMNAGSKTKQLAESIVLGAADNEDKLRRIYEWVRDNIRYIAVEIGIGGFQPYPVEDVLRHQYGDCKDMSTLICALGKEVGLNMQTALISTWQNGLPDTSLPSPLHFNHAIAFCPDYGDSGIWMDATEKSCPFGTLPWYDQGLPVLLVDDNGEAEIRTTPRFPDDFNFLKIDWDVKLHDNGYSEIKGKTIFGGAMAVETRRNLYNASSYSLQQWLETYLATKCAGAILDSFQFKGMIPVEDSVEILYNFHSRNFAVKRDKELIIRPTTILEMNLADQFRSAKRKYPIRLRYGVKRELNLKIELNSNHFLKTIPHSEKVENQFGTATWEWSIENNVLRCSIVYQLNWRQIPPENFQFFQEFLDIIREKDLSDIIISFE
jgi:hypothetical protein